MKKRIAAAAGASLLLIFAIAWWLLYLYGSQQTVPAETQVGGLKIGGLPVEKALTLLNEAWDAYENRTVQITMNPHSAERSEWTLGELGFLIERNEVRSALSKLREGVLLEKARYRYVFPRSFELKLQTNAASFDSRVRAEWGWLELNEPVNAQRTITDNDEIVYRPHMDAYRLDIGSLFRQVKLWAVTGGHAGGNPGPASDRPDTALHITSLGSAVQRASFKLPLTKLPPNITLEKLKAEGVERKITEFTTDFSASPAGRAYNVASTAGTLDNWELAPGEVFDYRKVIQATEEHYGFREAPVILNGKLVPGIGGGICQVSSTLYNAVLLAGLEIVERRNHSIPVSYLPVGRDATFSEGYINFRFRNTTGKHLIIRTETENRKLTVKLFGTMPGNISYRIESETVKIIEPPEREVSNAEVPPGERMILEPGKPGYEVNTYRIMQRDGKEVSRERVSHDVYKAQPTLVGVAEEGGAGKSGKKTPAPQAPSAGSNEDGRGETEPVIEDGLGMPGYEG